MSLIQLLLHQVPNKDLTLFGWFCKEETNYGPKAGHYYILFKCNDTRTGTIL